MQIAFHIGANCTDEDRLLKSILKNASALLQQGINVPGPGKYRSLIRETIQGLDGALPAPDTRNILLDAIIEDDNIKRIILTNDNFIAIPKRIFDHGVFYHQVEMKLRGLHQLFPGDDITLFMGMRNPVSFLHETFQRSGAATVSEYLGMTSPLDILWSDVIRRIKLAAPHTPLYVWCNEDTPLIWEDLIRLQSGIADDSALTGKFDVLAGIITEAGMQQLTARMQQENPTTTDERQNIIADILEEHALPDQIEDSIDLPGIDPAMINAMLEGYEDDLQEIAQMEGVELILPFS
jgi:hypothetical protein